MDAQNIALSVAGVAIAVFIGDYFVRFLLKNFQMTEEKGIKGAGRTIGMLERAITVLFIYAGEYNAIGLILAAKSIARFGELQDRKFAEYYLIGTLASVFFALLIGISTVELTKL